MSTVNVNINNLRAYLKTVVPVQAKLIEPFYNNQTALVNTVASTSLQMNINPKNEINKVVDNIPVTVTADVINPIPVNTLTSFIQTRQNQISVTSQGETDTIISNNLIMITNIEDVTNTGYTKNNSVANLYDSISSNYWNPQVNIGNANPYFYKLNYTFTSTSEIFKYVIKNNNSFPGFTNIRLYPTSNPSNYVDITPFVDTNNQYVNQTVQLLIDGNGSPLFNTNKMTAEYTLNPSIQPDTFYQYGQAYGVVYNTDTFGLRAGNYINTNTGAAAKLQWTTDYLLNQTTTTGTNNTDNNYLVSSDGQYRIAQNTSFYQLSTNSGSTYTKKTLNVTFPMKASSDGQYVMCYKYNNGTSSSEIYISSDYGNTFTIPYFITDLVPTVALSGISKSGETQCFIHVPYVSQIIFFEKSTSYGTNFQNSTAITISFGSSITYVNLFVKDDTTCTLFITINTQLYVYVHTGPYYNSWTNNAIYSSRSPDVVLLTESVKYIEQNYNSNSSLEGKYKTAVGTITGITSNELAILCTNNTDYTYTAITDHALFPEWYNPLSITTLNGACVKISPDGSQQVVIIIFNTTTISLYSTDSGNTWTRSAYFPTYLNICSNIVATDDFSIIQACGGYYYNYNGQYRTDPISYVSTDGGYSWVLNSAINPASSIVNTNYFEIKSQTNKTYFQIKDLEQNQVLGVSDNGFNMKRDLRVTDHNMYVLGGTLTVGPTELSALLNDYSLNIDGTLSARNVVLLSDERFKNIVGGVSKKQSNKDINKIDIVKYKFKDRPEDERIYTGIIAQDLEKIISDTVDINSSTYVTANGDININDLHSINYTSLLGYLISAIQYNQKRIDKLQTLLE